VLIRILHFSIQDHLFTTKTRRNQVKRMINSS
jgi:cellobiose-specific phosphotransferase system component IIA